MLSSVLQQQWLMSSLELNSVPGQSIGLTMSYTMVLFSLTWKSRIIELSKWLARAVGMFFKIRHYVTPETLKLLYYSLFFSFISYGIPV